MYVTFLPLLKWQLLSHPRPNKVEVPVLHMYKFCHVLYSDFKWKLFSHLLMHSHLWYHFWRLMICIYIWSFKILKSFWRGLKTILKFDFWRFLTVWHNFFTQNLMTTSMVTSFWNLGFKAPWPPIRKAIY